ncbi:acyl--CoA ligase [Aspergillus lucknowensis]|uniref:Acetyl-CoA synthetase-like protein n=1 Tax=Aspergillus lucknowensis TaxID=176173 RepID=A0ABR4LTA7_9EURO
MNYKSIYPHLNIPKTNLLSYLYPPNQTVSDRPIWIDAANPSHALSPRQMLTWVRRLGFGLDRLGVAPGKVVMVCTPNHIFVPMAYQGIVGAARIFSGANPTSTVSELEYQLRNTEAAALLVHPTLVETAVDAARRAGLPKDRIFLFSDNVEPIPPVNGIVDWKDMIGTEEEGNSWRWDEMVTTSTTTIATINYSSGTTGLPKGVCVSHRNLIANVEQTIFMRDLETPHALVPAARPEERWIGFLPLYHAYGQLFACMMAPKLNFPIYIMRHFVYEDFLATIQAHRITHLQVAPPILIMLDKRPETPKYNLTSLQHIICGAAPLSQDLQNAIQRRFGVRIVQGWGMTEVTCGAMHVPGGAHDETGSVGLLDPNCETKLVGEDGRPVGENTPGEIYVRGPNVCLGYWRNEPATQEALDADGWLRTGDVMVRRGDWFWVVDRKKELIKVNGLQVAPAELEAALLEHEGIADAGVVGVQMGEEERPRAYVLLQETHRGRLSPEEIQAYMRARVAKHKQLAGGVKIVDEIPRLASGKIQRKVLKEWARREASEMKSKL